MLVLVPEWPPTSSRAQNAPRSLRIRTRTSTAFGRVQRSVDKVVCAEGDDQEPMRSRRKGEENIRMLLLAFVVCCGPSPSTLSHTSRGGRRASPSETPQPTTSVSRALRYSNV